MNYYKINLLVSIFLRQGKKLLFLSVFITSVDFAFGQDEYADKPVISDPTIASFQKFIDNPVNKFNGGLDVNIPVYTLSDGDINIPISLRYNTSGIKVKEEASWVGLGWNLNVGGVITQMVNGAYDRYEDYNYLENYHLNHDVAQSVYPSSDELEVWDYYSGWKCNGGTPSYLGLSYSGVQAWTEECTTADYLQYAINPLSHLGAIWSLSEGQPLCNGEAYLLFTGDNASACHQLVDFTLLDGKGEPDIFSFSFGNYAGKFFIDYRDLSIHIIDKKEDILFEKYDNTNYGKWRAITPDGAQYYFGLTSVTSNIGTYSPVSISFLLTKMISPNGEVATFDYESVGVVRSLDSRNEYMYQDGFGIHTPSPTYSQIEYSLRTLKEITTKNHKINFTTATREDIEADITPLSIHLRGDRKLESIEIEDSNENQIKFFEFEYEYFNSSEEGNYYRNGEMNGAKKRLKLNSFGETGKPKYTFDYSSVQLPNKQSFAVDYWGYYNGKIYNEGLIPEFKKLYIDKRPYDQILPMPFYGHGDRYPGDRSSNIDFAIAGSLEKIHYPTGGGTSIEYESNAFYHYRLIPSHQQIEEYNTIASDRITSGTAYDDNCGSTAVYFFDLEEDTEVNVEFSINWGTASYLDVVNVNGYIATRHSTYNYPIETIKEYKPTFADDDANMTENFFLEVLPAGHYGVYVNVPNELGCQSESTGTLHISSKAVVTIKPELVLPDGFKDVSYGAGLRVKEITQSDIDESIALKTKYEYGNGALMSPLRFHTWRYWGDNDISNYIEIKVNSTSSIPTSTHAQGGLVGYGTVKEIRYGEGNNEGYTEYDFVNIPPMVGQFLPEISNFTNGKLRGESIYDVNSKLIRSTEFTYEVIKNHIYYGIKNLLSSTSSGGNIRLMRYPVRSKTVQVTSKTSTEYDLNEMPMSSVSEAYEYNSSNMLSKQTKEIGNNKFEISNFSYVYDYDGLDTDHNSMQNDHVIAPILKQEKFIDNKKIEEVHYDYNFYKQVSVSDEDYSTTKNIYHTNKVEVMPTGDNVEYEISYNYDECGNVSGVQQSNKPSTTYAWGYNCLYPVVVLENTAIDEVANAAIDEISDHVFSNSYDKTEIDSDITFVRSQLGTLNVSLLKQISIYTYKVGVGMTSQTDPNDNTVYYEYDDLNRLKLIKDQDGNVLKAYQYNYAND